ncbi:MAG TPA: RluA family pseudouridine synthase [Longimicrobiales bacterium]|nr:RluA family pseudouridine synthase [Longimicrobiales bacterium]
MTHDDARGDYREVEVSEEEAGARLDAWLSDRLEVSRTRVQRWLAAGEVRRLDEEGAGEHAKSDTVEPGWRFGVTIPAPKKTELVAEDIPLDIVYEDEDLAVVDKPAGMVVHPAPGHPGGTMVNALLHHLDSLGGVGGRLRPGIVHRLDRETSGLLVVAKTDRAQTGLQDALRKRKVKRLYTAMTWGHIRSDSWPLKIDAPIGRDGKDRKRMTVRPDGRTAVTRLRVRDDFPAAQLLDVALQTGRTHQIRVHLWYIGHPIVGEPVYARGGALGISGPMQGWARGLERRTPRQFLHAAELAFDHPVSGERVHVKSPLPEDLEKALTWARERR